MTRAESVAAKSVAAKSVAAKVAAAAKTAAKPTPERATVATVAAAVAPEPAEPAIAASGGRRGCDGGVYRSSDRAPVGRVPCQWPRCRCAASRRRPVDHRRGRRAGRQAVQRPAREVRGPAPARSRRDPPCLRDGRVSLRHEAHREGLCGARAAAAARAPEGAALDRGDGRAGRRAVRGARRGRQGRHDQALHGASQPAHRPRRGAGQAERARAHAVVFPALRRPPARGRRTRPVRPLLVQPRRRRARHGLLLAHRIPRVHAPVPGARAHAGALGHPPVQVLVLGVAGGAAPRFKARETDPLKQWKLSPIDRASLDKWDAYTEAKEAMFFYTDTADAPWTIVKSDDKKRARLAAMQHFLSSLPYPDKDTTWCAAPTR
jgi:hypothetical protein